MAKGQLRRVYFNVTEDGGFGLMPEPYPEQPYKAFPTVRYHATHDPKLIKNQQALDKLGKDWSDKPIRKQDADTREPQDE